MPRFYFLGLVFAAKLPITCHSTSLPSSASSSPSSHRSSSAARPSPAPHFAPTHSGRNRLPPLQPITDGISIPLVQWESRGRSPPRAVRQVKGSPPHTGPTLVTCHVALQRSSGIVRGTATELRVRHGGWQQRIGRGGTGTRGFWVSAISGHGLSPSLELLHTKISCSCLRYPQTHFWAPQSIPTSYVHQSL